MDTFLAGSGRVGGGELLSSFQHAKPSADQNSLNKLHQNHKLGSRVALSVSIALAAVVTHAQPAPVIPRPEIEALAPTKKELLSQLSAASATPVNFSVDPVRGALPSLQGEVSVAPKGSTPQVTAKAFLQKFGALYGVSPKNPNFTVTTLPGGAIDGSRVRITASYHGLPVVPAGISLDTNGLGAVVASCGVLPTIDKPVLTVPKIAADAAVSLVRKQLNIPATVVLKPTLAIYATPPSLVDAGNPVLAYSFDIPNPDGATRVYTSAANGKVLSSLPGIDSSVALPDPSCNNPAYHVNPATGVPDFISFGGSGLMLPEAAQKDPSAVALAFFSRYPLVFGTGDVPHQLVVTKVNRQTAAPFMVHVVLQQMYGGVPVLGAELGLHMNQGLAITSISGNYLRNPQMPLDATVSVADATTTATQAISPTLNAGGFVTHNLVKKGLVVVPGVLNAKLSVPHNDLAYWIQIPRIADVFVSATSNKVVYFIPNTASLERDVHDAGLGSPLTLASYPVVIHDDNLIGSPIADARSASTFLDQTVGFYSGLGWDSYNNGGGPVNAIVNSNFSPLMLCPNSFWDFLRSEMWFCPGMTTSDIVAHEFTHGVTLSTAGLFYLDEPGAVNEHYSDVLGISAAPNPPPTPGTASVTWQIGAGSAVAGCAEKVLRDMANPSASCPAQPNNYAQYAVRGPGCTDILDPLLKGFCDAGNVHTNSGIGNLAAVLTADGKPGSGHGGIDRNRMSRLFFETLTTRMFSWAGYLDELHNTWQAALDLSQAGVAVPCTVFTKNPCPSGKEVFAPNDKDEVAWAFNQVGIDPRLQSGWVKVGTLTSTSGTAVFNAGQSYPAPTTVSDVQLIVRGDSPIGIIPFYWTGRTNLSSGMPCVNFHGLFGACITASGVGTSSKQVTVTWTDSSYLPVDMSISLVPSTPVSTRQFQFVQNYAEHDAFIAGGKGNDSVNGAIVVGGTTILPAVTVSGDCKIDDVQVEALGRNGAILMAASKGMDAVGSANFPTWGAGIVTDGVGTSSMSATVHWYFDIGVAVRYQLHYYVSSATGQVCSIVP